MSAAPNWVDLVVVTLVIRTSCDGFKRGIWFEFLYLLGSITAASLACNLWSRAWHLLSPWLHMGPNLSSVLVFTLIFLTLILAGRMAIHRLAELTRGGILHWTTQWSGLLIGFVRGCWWAVFILLALLATGSGYIEKSIKKQSVLGRLVLARGEPQMIAIMNAFPGSELRNQMFPKIRARRRPQEDDKDDGLWPPTN